jgi:hypothetical protein
MLVIAGIITSVQGVPVANVAAWNANTGRWQALGALGVAGSDVVYALTVYNGDLIAGGGFANADGGTVVNNIARWDGQAWQPLGSGITGYVGSLRVYQGYLVAGGIFSAAGGVPASCIAIWDGTSWGALGAGMNGDVYEMTEYNGLLIAGGAFTTAGGVAANRIASWNGASWSPLGAGVDGPNTWVIGLTVFNGQLIAGGGFNTVSGVLAPCIAKWNGTSWSALGSGLDGVPVSLRVYNNELIAAGAFSHAGGNPANNIAKWNGVSWSALGAGTNGTPWTTNEYAGQLIAAGTFTTAGGATANNISRWNGSVWESFGGWAATMVNGMVPFRGRMAIAGNFLVATADQFADNLMSWDGVRLSNFGSGFDAAVNVLESFKYPLFSGDYELIAGGLFTQAGGVAANHIARWDEDPIQAFPPPAWQPMGSGFDDAVQAIERHNGQTYAGGKFLFSSALVNRIARWNETTDVWESMAGGMNGQVRALKSFGGFLYAGGDFTTAGGVATGGLARWNGSSWSAVGGTFSGQVHALEIHNNQLVIAGTFTNANGSQNVVAWDGNAFSTFGTIGTNGLVRALASFGGRLYAGGLFTQADGQPRNHLAAWNGTSWVDVAEGTSSNVFALAPFENDLLVGGMFSEVGEGLPSPAIARYSPTHVPWVAYHPFSQTVDAGQTAYFSITAAAFFDLTYQWLKNGVPIANGPTGSGSTIQGATTPNLKISSVSVLDMGDYSARIANTCGADTSFTATLTINGAVDVTPPVASANTVFQAIGPNPSQGPARLTFALARDGEVRASVLDVSGRRVRAIDFGRMPAGRHETEWDGRDAAGQKVRAGLFFVSLEVDGRPLGTRRLTVLR